MNDLTAYSAYLKALARDRTYVKVQYFTELHELITLNTLIRHLSQNGDEPMITLSTGEQIPLARVVSANGQFSPNYEGYAPYCETCDC